ncbi:MAG: hypothetical protein QOD41_4995, partial [Cryptosporangiaceae bacterium]|nr:hypothetical protein [Cryptosporangiaceae bacterium]
EAITEVTGTVRKADPGDAASGEVR